MGFVDLFLYAHHKHRQGFENSGNFDDCMKGRIRFMTAITHCLRSRVSGNMSNKTHACSLASSPKPDIGIFPNVRTTKRERGNDFQGWAIYTDGGARVVEGETSAGWSVIARSHHGRIDIMFGLVVTTEAHCAFSGALTKPLK